jgi:Domain of unknown function (DUF4349)
MPSLNEKTNDKPSPVFTRLTVDEVTRHTQARVAPPRAESARRDAPQRRRLWALGITFAVVALVLFAVFHSRPLSTPPIMRPDHSTASTMAPQMSARRQALAMQRTADVSNTKAPLETASTSTPAQELPLIARTVSLTLQVKDVGASRAQLDAILSRYRGYAAELNINTPENAPRSFSASLRIPAAALNAALEDLRKLGRVQIESQAGEEVTQQHTDLLARLTNARETEQRLRAILQQRTGKVEEVLQVEEQISSTRGDIERMEAEQKALEHRVDFATVQLQLAEVFTAQLNASSASVGTRMHNALVNGLGNAGDNVLGIMLFLEEYGPVLLVWLAILGAPAWLVWKRVQKAGTSA